MKLHERVHQTRREGKEKTLREFFFVNRAREVFLSILKRPCPSIPSRRERENYWRAILDSSSEALGPVLERLLLVGEHPTMGGLWKEGRDLEGGWRKGEEGRAEQEKHFLCIIRNCSSKREENWDQKKGCAEGKGEEAEKR